MSKDSDEVIQIFGDWRCQLCLVSNVFIAVIDFMNCPWLLRSAGHIFHWDFHAVTAPDFLSCQTFWEVSHQK